MSIRTRLTAALFVVALVPLIGVSLATYLYARSTITREVRAHLETVASIQETRVEDSLEHDRELLALMQSRTAMRQDLEAYERTGDALYLAPLDAMLRDARSSVQSFEGIQVFDSSGRMVASSVSDGSEPRVPEELLARARNENVIDVFFLGTRGELVHYIAGPLSMDGEFLGTIVIEDRADDYVALVSDYAGLGKSGETVLGYRNEKGEAVFITPLRFDRDAALTRIVPSGQKNVAVVRALAGMQGFWTDALDYRGHPIVASTRFIDDTGWGLAVKIDRSEALGPVNDLGIVLIAVVGLSLFVVLGVSLLVGRAITRPILRLTDVALDIGAGNLENRAEVRSDDEIGKLSAAFNSMTDGLVDARDDLEVRVEERTAELKAANEELDDYARTVSHDLRTLLVAINLNSELLRDELLGAGHAELATEYLDAMDKKLRDSFTLIRDLLAVARAGRLPESVTDVDVTEVVDRVRSALGPQLSARGAQVRVEGDLGIVKANETQVYQVFLNLLTNAVQHNADPGPVAEVSYLGKDRDGAHRYRVCDNGGGIPGELLDVVFVPFKRGAGGGHGVGLATVWKVVKTYGGDIRAYNDGGACFEFTLRDLELTTD
jgi:signal transduction histidine kinase